MDAVNMIGHRPLIDDHTHTLKVQVAAKQPQDTNEKWGLAIPSAPGAVSAESSGSSQHADHPYGTL
jgi:hypothetical protein